jgi:hypothetical protein
MSDNPDRPVREVWMVRTVRDGAHGKRDGYARRGDGAQSA